MKKVITAIAVSAAMLTTNAFATSGFSHGDFDALGKSTSFMETIREGERLGMIVIKNGVVCIGSQAACGHLVAEK